jgi:Cu/Zn superoxide dismutase
MKSSATAAVPAVAAAVLVSLATAGSASAASAAVAPSVSTANSDHVTLHAMPAGTVRFSRLSHNRLGLQVTTHGLTPGSSHFVDLVLRSGQRVTRFSTLTANSGGSTYETLTSGYTGLVPEGSQVIIRMGTTVTNSAALPIAETGRLGGVWRTEKLRSVEVGWNGVHWGTPHGHATVVYNRRRKTLTVTVNAGGVTPGPHAAHIHVGSCESQGAVKYMLGDLSANKNGRIVNAVRVIKHVTSPIPAKGWYLNIHQGNTGDIQDSSGKPTIYFRPLLCSNIKGSRG